MNSRLATSVKKIAPPRMFTCEYTRTFRASTVRSCMSSAFLIKFRVVYYKAAALLRRCSTIAFFLKKKTFFIVFKQLVFGTFPKKNLWWIFFIAKLQSENCRLITLLKETPPYKFPWELSKILQSIVFLNISTCGEEVNSMKDYMKARR